MDLRKIAHYYNYAYIGLAMGISAYVAYALLTFSVIGGALPIVVSALGVGTLVLVVLNMLVEEDLEERPKRGR